MVSDHSVTSSSQQVREDRTVRRSSHRSLLMYTFRLALIQATMSVCRQRERMTGGGPKVQNTYDHHCNTSEVVVQYLEHRSGQTS